MTKRKATRIWASKGECNKSVFPSSDREAVCFV